MGRKIRVGVIFGGKSGEHDVSLRSARAVMAALDPEGFEVVPIGITREGQWLAGGDPLTQLESGSELARLEGRPAGAYTGGSAPGNELAKVADADRGDRGCRAGEGVAQPLDVDLPRAPRPQGEDGTVQGLLELAGMPYVGRGRARLGGRHGQGR